MTSSANKALIKKHRGIYAGPVGGKTPDSGPDFNQISEKLINATRVFSKNEACNEDLSQTN